MQAVLAAIRKLYKDRTALPIEKSQETTIKTHTFFTVTTCLYLSPNNNARSLSTLIAVSVSKDTPQKITPILFKRIPR